MDHIITTIGIGIAAFAATNIDNLFVLLALFSDSDFSPLQIVVGQYLGMTMLIGVSIVCSFVSLVIPAAWLGLLGIFPTVVGFRKLAALLRGAPEAEPDIVGEKKQARHWVGAQALVVMLITISNGGDNISVYAPLFANMGLARTLALSVLFLVLVAAWCGAGYYLTRHPSAGARIRRLGRNVLPFVLIGVGLATLSRAFPLLDRVWR